MIIIIIIILIINISITIIDKMPSVSTVTYFRKVYNRWTALASILNMWIMHERVNLLILSILSKIVRSFVKTTDFFYLTHKSIVERVRVILSQTKMKGDFCCAKAVRIKIAVFTIKWVSLNSIKRRCTWQEMIIKTITTIYTNRMCVKFVVASIWRVFSP